MDESYTSLLAAGIEQKYRRLEMEIMEDVIRRIRKAGSITSAADWQMQRLFVLGSSQKNIEQLMRKAVDGNEAEVRRLYEEVISREYTRSRALYEAAGREFIPYEQNLELRQITNALIAQSSEELYNITKSAGFMLADGHGGKVFTPLSDVYNGWLDNAMLGMAHGAYDYNTLVRRTVSQMTASGLRSGRTFRDGGSDYGIDYASGWHNRIDVAVRRALLTGFGQLAGQIADRNAQQLHTQYFEVTWHPASRPSHAVWQGKVYTKEELVSKCGLGTGPGLHGWNCRHDYYPFLPGVSERSYSDEWLETQNRREMTPTRYKGKEYTAYEATQKQRQMETALRAQREKVQLLREGGAEKDEVTLAQCKYQAQLDEYKRFSRAMGLQEQTERIYTGRTRGRISPSPQAHKKFPKAMIDNAARDINQYRRYKEILGKDAGSLAEFGQRKYNDSEKWKYLKDLKAYLEKYPTSDRRYFDAHEKLKSLGIKKGVLLPPVQKQAFILPEGKKDPHHIMKRMLERNITDDDVRSYMQNAKAMFVQWNGQRQLFVSNAGMCLVAKVKNEWVYKTVWSEYDFDEESEKILEVLKSVGL